MSKNNIRTVHAKKFKITTNSKHNYTVCDNILNRNFNPRKGGESLGIRYYIYRYKRRLALSNNSFRLT